MDKPMLLMLVDVVVSTLSVTLAWFIQPDIADKIMILVGLWQPMIIYWIKSEKDKAVALLSRGIDPKTMRPLTGFTVVGEPDPNERPFT